MALYNEILNLFNKKKKKKNEEGGASNSTASFSNAKKAETKTAYAPMTFQQSITTGKNTVSGAITNEANKRKNKSTSLANIGVDTEAKNSVAKGWEGKDSSDILKSVQKYNDVVGEEYQKRKDLYQKTLKETGSIQAARNAVDDAEDYVNTRSAGYNALHNLAHGTGEAAGYFASGMVDSAANAVGFGANVAQSVYNVPYDILRRNKAQIEEQLNKDHLDNVPEGIDEASYRDILENQLTNLNKEMSTYNTNGIVGSDAVNNVQNAIGGYANDIRQANSDEGGAFVEHARSVAQNAGNNIANMAAGAALSAVTGGAIAPEIAGKITLGVGAYGNAADVALQQTGNEQAARSAAGTAGMNAIDNAKLQEIYDAVLARTGDQKIAMQYAQKAAEEMYNNAAVDAYAQTLRQTGDPLYAHARGLTGAANEEIQELISPNNTAFNNVAGNTADLLNEGLQEAAGTYMEQLEDPLAYAMLGGEYSDKAKKTGREALNNIAGKNAGKTLKEAGKSFLGGVESSLVLGGLTNPTGLPQGIADDAKNISAIRKNTKALNEIDKNISVLENPVFGDSDSVKDMLNEQYAQKAEFERFFAGDYFMKSSSPALRKNAQKYADTLLETSAKLTNANISPASLNSIKSLSKATKTAVEFNDGLQDAEGNEVRGVYKDGVIHINSKATADEAVETILAHEMAHSFETSENYNAYKKALNELVESGGIDIGYDSVDDLKAALKNTYGNGLSDDEIDNEAVATITEKLIGNEGALKELAENNSSLAGRFSAWLDNTEKQVSGNAVESKLAKVQKMLNRAINTTARAKAGEEYSKAVYTKDGKIDWAETAKAEPMWSRYTNVLGTDRMDSLLSNMAGPTEFDKTSETFKNANKKYVAEFGKVKAEYDKAKSERANQKYKQLQTIPAFKDAYANPETRDNAVNTIKKLAIDYGNGVLTEEQVSDELDKSFGTPTNNEAENPNSKAHEIVQQTKAQEAQKQAEQETFDQVMNQPKAEAKQAKSVKASEEEVREFQKKQEDKAKKAAEAEAKKKQKAERDKIEATYKTLIPGGYDRNVRREFNRIVDRYLSGASKEVIKAMADEAKYGAFSDLEAGKIGPEEAIAHVTKALKEKAGVDATEEEVRSVALPRSGPKKKAKTSTKTDSDIYAEVMTQPKQEKAKAKTTVKQAKAQTVKKTTAEVKEEAVTKTTESSFDKIAKAAGKIWGGTEVRDGRIKTISQVADRLKNEIESAGLVATKANTIDPKYSPAWVIVHDANDNLNGIRKIGAVEEAQTTEQKAEPVETKAEPKAETVEQPKAEETAVTPEPAKQTDTVSQMRELFKNGMLNAQGGFDNVQSEKNISDEVANDFARRYQEQVDRLGEKVGKGNAQSISEGVVEDAKANAKEQYKTPDQEQEQKAQEEVERTIHNTPKDKIKVNQSAINRGKTDSEEAGEKDTAKNQSKQNRDEDIANSKYAERHLSDIFADAERLLNEFFEIHTDPNNPDAALLEAADRYFNSHNTTELMGKKASTIQNIINSFTFTDNPTMLAVGQKLRDLLNERKNKLFDEANKELGVITQTRPIAGENGKVIEEVRFFKLDENGKKVELKVETDALRKYRAKITRYAEALDKVGQSISGYTNDAGTVLRIMAENIKNSPAASFNNMMDSIEKIQKQVDKANKGNIDIVQAIKSKYQNAWIKADDTGRIKMAAEIAADVGTMMPTTTKEKIDAWRMMMMLANPTTHIRNFGGNALMQGIVSTRNMNRKIIENALKESIREHEFKPRGGEHHDEDVKLFSDIEKNAELYVTDTMERWQNGEFYPEGELRLTFNRNFKGQERFRFINEDAFKARFINELAYQWRDARFDKTQLDENGNLTQATKDNIINRAYNIASQKWVSREDLRTGNRYGVKFNDGEFQQTKQELLKWFDDHLDENADMSKVDSNPNVKGFEKQIYNAHNAKPFDSNALNAVYQKNNWALAKEDSFFTRRRYAREMMNIMTAQGYKLNGFREDGTANIYDYNSKKTLTKEAAQEVFDRISEEALNDALESTYHDASRLADTMNQLANVHWAIGLAMDSIAPFRKTPINITKRMIEYSPVSLAKALFKYRDVQKGKITADQYINTLAKGMTGSEIFALGMALAYYGLLRGTGDEDDSKVKKFEDELAGKQDYSLVIKDATYTLGWLAPVSGPLFAGVQLMQEIENASNGEGFNGLDVLKSTIAPILDASFFSGIQNSIDTANNYVEYGYQLTPNGEVHEADFLTGLVIGAVQNYVGQLTPSAGGKLIKAKTGKDLDTFSPNVVEKMYKTAASKDLFLYEISNDISRQVTGHDYLQPRVNSNGEEMEARGGNLGGRLAYQMLSPGSYKKDRRDNVDIELERLYKSTGQNYLLPSNMYSLGDRSLSGNDKYTYNKEVLSAQKKSIAEFINSNSYGDYTDTERAQIIRQIRTGKYHEAEYKYYSEHGYRDAGSFLTDSDKTRQTVMKIARKTNGSTFKEWQYYAIKNMENDVDENGDQIYNSKAVAVRNLYEKEGIWDGIYNAIESKKIKAGAVGLTTKVANMTDAEFSYYGEEGMESSVKNSFSSADGLDKQKMENAMKSAGVDAETLYAARYAKSDVDSYGKNITYSQDINARNVLGENRVAAIHQAVKDGKLTMDEATKYTGISERVLSMGTERFKEFAESNKSDYENTMNTAKTLGVDTDKLNAAREATADYDSNGETIQYSKAINARLALDESELQKYKTAVANGDMTLEEAVKQTGISKKIFKMSTDAFLGQYGDYKYDPTAAAGESSGRSGKKSGGKKAKQTDEEKAAISMIKRFANAMADAGASQQKYYKKQLESSLKNLQKTDQDIYDEVMSADNLAKKLDLYGIKIKSQA